MDNFYIYQYCADHKEKESLSLVIFCSGLSIEIGTLKDKLRDFFRKNPPPRKIFVIGGSYLKKELTKIFKENKSGLFDVIPNYLIKDEEIRIICFDSTGKLTSSNGTLFNESQQLLKAGMLNIFNIHGGLIEAPSETYHYVFPSGKHSTRFIRAGNVLVHGAEIFFIAISLLKWLKADISHIYSDTSSINSLSYALLELKRRFDQSKTQPTVVSFGSYDKFENFDFKDSKNSLIIISASTSGRIVKRLFEKHPNLKNENIVILFYLSNDAIESNIICDLTYKHDSFPNGFHADEMYEGEVDCKFCQNGSYTVKISGDIFLLEKPKINTLTLNKSDAPDFLSHFMQKFHAQKGVNLIRCFYGEDQTRTFEIFFKTDVLVSGINKLASNFFIKEEFKKKFDKTLSQYVPSDLKIIIYLDDEGSKLISQKILKSFNTSKKIKLLSSKDFALHADLRQDESGAILVVCSCLVTGNNLLYVNKYLRRFQKMSKTFFTLFARTENEQNFEFIKKNIGQGEFGINTNHFIHIEKITCSQNSEFSNSRSSLIWSHETDFLKRLYRISEEVPKFEKASKFIKGRLQILADASDKGKGGLINEVFFRNPVNNRALKINKNFAFFDFDGYHNKTSQADIYFTMSTVLNHLRNSSELKRRKIVQEEQVRTIIDPGNFIRFDDGIIQAAILRSATSAELNYKLSYKHSNQISLLISKMVDSYKDAISSEALIEFLFVIAIKKLRINEGHLVKILDKIDLSVLNPVILLFSHFIRRELGFIKA